MEYGSVHKEFGALAHFFGGQVRVGWGRGSRRHLQVVDNLSSFLLPSILGSPTIIKINPITPLSVKELRDSERISNLPKESL